MEKREDEKAASVYSTHSPPSKSKTLIYLEKSTFTASLLLVIPVPAYTSTGSNGNPESEHSVCLST